MAAVGGEKSKSTSAAALCPATSGGPVDSPDATQRVADLTQDRADAHRRHDQRLPRARRDPHAGSPDCSHCSLLALRQTGVLYRGIIALVAGSSSRSAIRSGSTPTSGNNPASSSW